MCTANPKNGNPRHSYAACTGSKVAQSVAGLSTLFVFIVMLQGNQDRWWIAVIATCAFFALVVTVPVIYEYALNDAQREKVDNFFAKLSFKKNKRRAAKAIDYTDFKALPIN